MDVIVTQLWKLISVDPAAVTALRICADAHTVALVIVVDEYIHVAKQHQLAELKSVAIVTVNRPAPASVMLVMLYEGGVCIAGVAPPVVIQTNFAMPG